MSTRVAPLTGVLLLTAVGLAGCGADHAGYVALGDSYTAAPQAVGVGTRAGCGRSEENYPALVAERLGDLDLADRSCSGASTEDLDLDVLDDGTELVTVGIGANDGHIFSILVTGCAALAAKDPAGAPCVAELEQTGEDLMARADAAADAVAETLDQVSERAPDAEVLLVGYPVIFPATGSCPDRLPLAAGDTAYAARVMRHLNEELEAAASRKGVTFLDVQAATEGHDICAEDPWIQGVGHELDAPMQFHPTAEEQQVVADLVVAAYES